MRVRKKTLLIALAALLAAGGIAALGIFVLLPMGRYHRAEAMLAKGDAAGAFEAFDRLRGYRDAETRKEKLQAEALGSRAAESMAFGGYDWLVLEARDGRALLLMKDILELRPFNESMEETTWEACTLRAYLNGEFYGSFAPKDRLRIAETAVANSGNPESGVRGGEDTKDYVFLLSLAQARFYFPEDAARAARFEGAAAWWWLRSPGIAANTAATVGSDGRLGYAGSGVSYRDRGVRPAIWVALGA